MIHQSCVDKNSYKEPRPVARGGLLGSDEPPLKNHQTIKNEYKRVLKEYIALFRPLGTYSLCFVAQLSLNATQNTT